MHAAPRPSTCRPSNAAGRRFRLTRISRGRARRCHKSRPPREFSPYLSPLFPDARGSGKSARCGACWLDHVARPRARPRRKTRTLSNLQRNDFSFSDLGVAEPLCRALAAEGYNTPRRSRPRPSRRCSQGRDLLGIAQTGTGKTAAFALPMLQHWPQRPHGRHGAPAR